MHISLVVAMTPEGVIGRDGGLPWRLPADMRHFRRLTMGHPVVMGRRTYESIGAPLEGRTNIVLSGDPGFTAPGVMVARTPAQALAQARDSLNPMPSSARDVMVIGGATVYAVFLPQASTLYITRVHAALSGDTYFPALAVQDWLETARSDHPVDERNPYACTFLTLQRRVPTGGSGT